MLSEGGWFAKRISPRSQSTPWLRTPQSDAQGCDRLVYYESFDDVHKAIGREKRLKGWFESEEDCFDRVGKTMVGGFCRKLGRADGVCRRSDQWKMRLT
jgi:hypothetical protein